MISELESIAAIRPRALHSEYGQQTKGILGAITTSACSPASMYGGSSTFWLPVFLPIFHLIFCRQQGALAVRTWTVGVNPPIQESPFLVAAFSWPGWSCTKTMAENVLTHLGWVLASSDMRYMTSPTLGIVSLARPLTLTPTLSPTVPLGTFLWCISMVKALPVTPVGANPTGSLGQRKPCSIRPVITSPTPLILYTPLTGILKGLLSSRLGGLTSFSRASYRVVPEIFFFFLVTSQPF